MIYSPDKRKVFQGLGAIKEGLQCQSMALGNLRLCEVAG